MSEILRYFVALLMLAAATAKLRDLAGFRDNLASLFGMGPALRALVAPAIPVAELAVAALLLGGLARTGLLAALLMLCGFTALVGYKFSTQSVVRCSCFGEAERSLSGLDLLRNGLVIAAIGAGLMLPAGAALPLHAALLAASLGLLVCVIAVHFHEIVHLLSPGDG
ncbi:MauE/DoxX family redox-associated membrane protein [Duganella rhizosphaerae]|uniref:MauE/DoxX family redox-associated membrane protein n=1 Tax=Duganella rhizosphaerae TaxID=2885763 RepID=UPI00403FA577